MHICNDQAVVQSGGLNRTAEEETSNEVKFSLSHFSKHFVESETTEESIDSISDNNLSEDSLRHLVFADYQGREVWNHFNQKSFLEFETGVIQEISKYLPERTHGFDQIMEAICRYTYNCCWKGSSHPFNKHIASKSQLPRQCIPRCMRTIGSFVNALQSYKAFDLTYHPDGPQSYHVVITAKLRNKRDVTVYYFKVEPSSCIDTLKRLIEAEEGINAHHQRWYSSITGKEASPGPFDAARIGEDKSINGMAYYLQQGGLYLDMSNHSQKDWVPHAERKPNEASLPKCLSSTLFLSTQSSSTQTQTGSKDCLKPLALPPAIT
jgi:hypothetical protein